MTGRLTKLRRRRDTAAADPAGAATAGPAAEHPTSVMPAVQAPLFADAAPAPAPTGPPLPADVAPGTEAGPGFRDRGAYRRRLRYLRRVRELGFRDLGGLVFDLHRFGRTGDEIVRAKLVALDAVDRELRALERVLKDERAFTDLREPGVAACARCGGLHGSDANFCPSCGIAVGGPTALGVPVATDPAVVDPGATDAPQAVAVAAPIMPLPEPEPAPTPEPFPTAETATPDGPPPAPEAQPEALPEPEPRTAAEPDVPAVSAAQTGSTPVTAAALGLPVPSPPPVPPLPPVDAGDRPR